MARFIGLCVLLLLAAAASATAEEDPSTRPKPNLYFLSIGVGNYADPRLRLRFPAKDAVELGKAFHAQALGFYDHVDTRILVDGDATRANILEALDRLSHHVGTRDYAIIYLAGHIVSLPGEGLAFLPADVSFDHGQPAANAISAAEIRERLSFLAGRVIVLSDLCESAAINGKPPPDVTGFLSTLASDEVGVVAFSGCTTGQASFDGAAKNGPFAEALIATLGDPKAYGNDGMLTLYELERQLAARQGRLTNGRLSAVMLKPDTVPIFPLAAFPGEPIHEETPVPESHAANGAVIPDIEVLNPPGARAAGERGVTVFEDRETAELKVRIVNADRFKRFALGDQEVFPDSDGLFEIEEELQEGDNRFLLSAVDGQYRFSFRPITVTRSSAAASPEPAGKRYALVIAVSAYDHFSGLQTPHNDGEAIARLLHDTYGFATEIDTADGGKRSLLLLDNPLRYEIFDTLQVLSDTMGENDSLLIYYAGHGYQRDKAAPAFWIPRDGEPNRTFTYISAEGLLDEFQQMHARSILVVSDSCFSGALFRAASPEPQPGEGADREQAMTVFASHRSRIFISSGRDEPVLDAGCGRESAHSVFACAFMDGLARMAKRKFRSHELYEYLGEHVVTSADQIPQWRELLEAGHEGGDFIFEPRP